MKHLTGPFLKKATQLQGKSTSKSNNVCLISRSLNIKTPWGFSQVNKMRACESLTTNGSCMIIQRNEEMFHWSSSVNKKKHNIIIKIKAVLYAINSAWPCLHMLLVYLNLSMMFPSYIWIDWLHWSICCAPISLVTMQHQSIVLRQSP